MHLCAHKRVCPPHFLRSSAWSRYLVQTLSIDVMSLWPQNVHSMSKGLHFEEGLFVLLVAAALLQGVLFHALGLLDALSTGLKNAEHLGAQANIFCIAPSISLGRGMTSCLWRNTGSVHSSVPSGPVFRSWTLRASWNFMPLRARISSSSFIRIRGRIFSKEVLGSAPYLSGISICQPLKKLPIIRGVC